MSITIETMKNRKSVRTFNDTLISEDILMGVRDYFKQIENPFQVPIDFRLLNAKENGLSSPVIAGEEFYIAAKYEKAVNAEVAFGYAFEKFILHATELGLGTVWLAATISRKGFERAIDLQENEVMPAVSPIGYAADKRSLKERAMRKGMKSDSRVAFDSIFFVNDFEHSLKESDAGKWKTPLEMVRWAPSATNKQPWRVIVNGDEVHFYEEKARGYAKESTGDVQKVDLGIALCHFEIAAKEIGLEGRILQEDPGIVVPENTEYIATYKLEG